jgi:hypothetical protein
LAFLREVCVYRSSGVVHLFNVVPHGRRFLRSLVWASDAALCLHDGEAALGFVGGETDADLSTSAPSPGAAASTPTLEILEQEAYAGRAATEPSLVILRNILREMGVQVYVPRRFLRGLLPAALLSAYDFWQNGDDSLIGYPAADHAAGAPTAAPSGGAESDTTAAAVGSGTVVRVLLRKEEGPDRSGFGRAEATASVMRVVMMTLTGETDAADLANPSRDLANPSTDPFEGGASPLVQAVEDPTQEPLTLLNLLLAVGDAGLSERDEAQPWQAMAVLAELLLRVEDLSHILVWHLGAPPEADDGIGGTESPPQPCRVHLVELPRLGLTFAPKRAYQDRSAPGDLLGKAAGAVDPWRFDPFADSNAVALAPDADPFVDPFEPSAVNAEVRPRNLLAYGA